MKKLKKALALFWEYGKLLHALRLTPTPVDTGKSPNYLKLKKFSKL